VLYIGRSATDRRFGVLALHQPQSMVAGSRQMDRAFWVFAALAALSAICYLAIDPWAIETVVRAHLHPESNYWVRAFTRLGKGWLQVWLLLAWFLIRPRQRRTIMMAFIALGIVAIGVNALKLTVGRPRPYETLESRTSTHHTRGLSFPSGDTATLVAITTVILPAVSGPVKLVLPVCCIGIGLLRVAAKAHYPSDVLAGAAVGVLLAWLVVRLVEKHDWFERKLPFERWLILGGLVGIPLVLGLSKGFAEVLAVSQMLGLVVPVVLTADWAGYAMKTASERTLSFLSKHQFRAILLTLGVVVAANILTGRKPRELMPFGDRPVNPIAAAGLILVIGGVAIRLYARSGHPHGLPIDRATLRRMCLGMFLVVCGLLAQLRDPMNWPAVLPVFALFYGVPVLGSDWPLVRLVDARWWSGRVWPLFAGVLKYRPRSGRAGVSGWKPCVCTEELCMSLLLLLLPVAIELIVEEVVFERILRM
jgi:membrane-associated phospholipid phosphatase